MPVVGFAQQLYNISKKLSFFFVFLTVLIHTYFFYCISIFFVSLSVTSLFIHHAPASQTHSLKNVHIHPEHFFYYKIFLINNVLVLPNFTFSSSLAFSFSFSALMLVCDSFFIALMAILTIHFDNSFVFMCVCVFANVNATEWCVVNHKLCYAASYCWVDYLSRGHIFKAKDKSHSA